MEQKFSKLQPEYLEEEIQKYIFRCLKVYDNMVVYTDNKAQEVMSQYFNKSCAEKDKLRDPKINACQALLDFTDHQDNDKKAIQWYLCNRYQNVRQDEAQIYGPAVCFENEFFKVCIQNCFGFNHTLMHKVALSPGLTSLNQGQPDMMNLFSYKASVENKISGVHYLLFLQQRRLRCESNKIKGLVNPKFNSKQIFNDGTVYQIYHEGFCTYDSLEELNFRDVESWEEPWIFNYCGIEIEIRNVQQFNNEQGSQYYHAFLIINGKQWQEQQYLFNLCQDPINFPPQTPVDIIQSIDYFQQRHLAHRLFFRRSFDIKNKQEVCNLTLELLYSILWHDRNDYVTLDYCRWFDCKEKDKQSFLRGYQRIFENENVKIILIGRDGDCSIKDGKLDLGFFKQRKINDDISINILNEVRLKGCILDKKSGVSLKFFFIHDGKVIDSKMTGKTNIYVTQGEIVKNNTQQNHWYSTEQFYKWDGKFTTVDELNYCGIKYQVCQQKK